MKRSRLSSRTPSRTVAELEQLALGFAESGSRLEDAYWETTLHNKVADLLENGAENELTAAIEHLFNSHPAAHDELADVLESVVETAPLEFAGQAFTALLFAIPILAWSRMGIPSGSVADKTKSLRSLQKLLGKEIFTAGVQLALADCVFSPEQLPPTFAATLGLHQAMQPFALAGEVFLVDPSTLPTSERFLSDVRYLIGVAAIPLGQAPFRWNKPNGDKAACLAAWEKGSIAALTQLLPGCAFRSLLPNAYYTANREGEKETRPYALEASIAFLTLVLGLEAKDISATIAACYERELVEFRIGFSPLRGEAVYYGAVWTLFEAANEVDPFEMSQEIESILRKQGITDVCILSQRLPLEFCDDCGAPLFPHREGELLHPEFPENPKNPVAPLLH